MECCKILSLDGGGSWALIQAKTLGNIFGENTKGHEILNHFGLAIANSGGSIVLGGLTENKTPREILDYFLEQESRDSIFVKKPFYETIPNSALDVGPKYDAAEKLNGLNALFKKGCTATLEAMRGDPNKPYFNAHIVICAFDYDRQRAKFFRSNLHSRAASRQTARTLGKATLTQAIHASTNAPVNYFDAPAKLELPGGTDLQFWDGGVGGYNNPVMAGVAEILALPTPPEHGKIRVLSIGTGSIFLPLASVGGKGDPVLFQEPVESSLLGDIRCLAKAIIGDPPDAATFVAHLVLDGRLPDANAPETEPTLASDKVIRLNPLIQPFGDLVSGWTFPPGLTRNQFSRLRKLDMDATEQKDVKLIEALVNAWLKDNVRNQPVRIDGTTLKCEIGHQFYSQAKADLLKWLFVPCSEL